MPFSFGEWKCALGPAYFMVAHETKFGLPLFLFQSTFNAVIRRVAYTKVLWLYVYICNSFLAFADTVDQ